MGGYFENPGVCLTKCLKVPVCFFTFIIGVKGVGSGFLISALLLCPLSSREHQTSFSGEAGLQKTEFYY